MIYHIVSILDTAVSAFGRPAFVRSKNEGIRSFTDEVNRKGTPNEPNNLNAHPQDYRLFFMGTWDDSNGRFTTPEVPELLADAKTLINT